MLKAFHSVCLVTVLSMLLPFGSFSRAQSTDSSDLDQTDVWKGMSPDGHFLAAVRRWPSDDWNAFFNRDDDSFRVVIQHWDNELSGDSVYARWESKVGQRIPAQIQWSPDSRFLVMTTRNAGGHHPAKCTAFVFCVSDRTFRIIDSAEGEIGDTKFEFVGPDKITMNHLNENMDGDIPFTFSLSREVQKMKKESVQ